MGQEYRSQARQASLLHVREQRGKLALTLTLHCDAI